MADYLTIKYDMIENRKVYNIIIWCLHLFLILTTETVWKRMQLFITYFFL